MSGILFYVAIGITSEVMKAMEISLDVEEAFNEEIKGISGYRNATTFSRSGIVSRADVTRGSGGSSATSMASNALEGDDHD